MTEALAREILDRLYDAYTRRKGLHILADDFHIAWRFHKERNLSFIRRENVLTIQAIHLAAQHRRRGILTSMVKEILEGDQEPPIPLQFLHFQECNEHLGAALSKLHFHRYEIGQTVDWWHPVTGQKELL